MTKQIGSIVPTIFIVHFLAVGIAVMIGTPAQAAEDCIAGPNAPSPKGSHWYYRVDRAKNRKCWYLRPHDRAVQSVAPQSARKFERVAEADPAGESSVRPVAVEQPTAWPSVMLSTRREVADTTVRRQDSLESPQNVDRQRVGLNMAAAQATLTSNETVAQSEAPLDSLALAAAPTQDSATITPLRVLLLVVGLLIVPGVMLRMIFRFGASPRRRMYAGGHDNKRGDGVARNWAPAPFAPTEAPPLAPVEPLDRTVAVEQLLRKILWELDRGAVEPMPDPVNGDLRRYGRAP
ncbi:MAG: hypothetical protein QOF09_4513 [Alphaproteobacteria bacterium]|jgi:hypothetical protein|nr:hypothetical protein [Alphaproteobacteria bacterium]